MKLRFKDLRIDEKFTISKYEGSSIYVKTSEDEFTHSSYVKSKNWNESASKSWEVYRVSDTRLIEWLKS